MNPLPGNGTAKYGIYMSKRIDLPFASPWLRLLVFKIDYLCPGKVRNIVGRQ